MLSKQYNLSYESEKKKKQNKKKQEQGQLEPIAIVATVAAVMAMLYQVDQTPALTCTPDVWKRAG